MILQNDSFVTLGAACAGAGVVLTSFYVRVMGTVRGDQGLMQDGGWQVLC